jgi:uncharacterized repeat protein (TIGR02543 family)
MQANGIDGNNVVGTEKRVSLESNTTYYEGFLTTTSGSAYGPFYYPSPSQAQDEGEYTNYTYTTRALGISGSNVVGYWEDENLVYHGFIYNTGTAAFTAVTSPSGGGCPVTCIDGSNAAGYYADPNHSYNYSGYIFDTTASNYITSIRDPLAPQNTYLLGISGTTVAGYFIDSNAVTHGFVAVPTVTTPTMAVFSGASQITNNQTAAINVGSVVQGQTGPIANFTVTNSGGGTLYLTNISAPAGFTVIPGFPTSIAAASNGTFSVQLDSNNVGNFSGNVVITNSDANNNPFTFAIAGSVSNALANSPQIEVFYGAVQIANNQLNAINFGSVPEGQTGPILNFTVTNSGTAILYVTNISASSGFSVIAGYPASIAASSSGSFSVQLNTSVAGLISGNLVITNGDPNNNPFSIGISGTVTTTTNDLVSLLASPAGAGTVSSGGIDGGGLYPQGAQLSVVATANAGYEFIGWSGDATGAVNPLTVIVSAPLTITANFAATNMPDITVLVITNGSGKILPNLNGVNLVKNHNYTIKATPAAGNLFVNWTGSINTNKNPLTFKAETDMLLQANFVTNPFLSTQGTYNGLFSVDSGVTEQTAGMLKGLAVNNQGHYSGVLLINGGSHGISGTFDVNGQATNKITRPAAQGGTLSLEMTLSNPGNAAPLVTGTIYGTNDGTPWAATNLLAYHATNTLPAAEYTMLIPPDVNNTPPNGSPGGDGYALITNNPGPVNHPASAAAKIIGALADGTAFNQTVAVSKDGYAPVYASLYAGKGLLLGWINLNLTNTTAVSNTSLTWIHPAKPSGLYKNGFTNLVLTNQILLEQWTNPPGSFLDLSVSLLESINDGTVLTNIPVNVNSLGKITGTSVQGTIAPKTGLVTVTVGSGANKVTGHGVMLNTSEGGGYYLTKTNNAQAILLGP